MIFTLKARVYLFFIFMGLMSANIQANELNFQAVATSDSNAAKIAYKILNAGGNAIDAGIAAMYALSISEPFSSGPGAVGMMLIYSADSSKAYFIDFMGRVPLNINSSGFYNIVDNVQTARKSGLASVCTPGFISGTDKAIKLFGSKSFKEILEPVIVLAKNGSAVSQGMSKLLRDHYDYLQFNSATSDIFYPDWIPPNQNDLLIRKDLALTYKLISQKGAEVFYRGEIADQIVKQMASENGLIYWTDLATYEVVSGTSEKIEYHGLDVMSVPMPGIGGYFLLNLLKTFDKIDFADFQPGSGEYIHKFVETYKHNYLHLKNHFLDRKISTDKKYLLSDQECSEILVKLKLEHIINIEIESFNSRESNSSSHISVIDQKGNAFVGSQSLNRLFGSGETVEKYGILLNDCVNTFADKPNHPNSISSGGKSWTFLTPMIILKNGVPVLSIGCSGGERSISTLAQLALYLVEFELEPEETIKMPRFHFNVENNLIELESRINTEAIDYLKKLGYKVKLFSDFDIAFGNAQIVINDTETGKIIPVSDVREEGVIYIDR